MLRFVVCSALFLSVATTPVLADASSEAIAECAKWIKRDGIAIQVSNDYSASGSGERFSVSTRGTVSGKKNARITCKVNKGRVTDIQYG